MPRFARLNARTLIGRIRKPHLIWSSTGLIVLIAATVTYFMLPSAPTSHEPKSTATQTPVPSISNSPTGTPVLTPSPSPIAPMSAKASKYGFSAGDITELDTKELNARLDDMKRLGTGWVRFDMHWSGVQPNDANSYNWGAYDRVVSAIRSRGMHSLAILDYTPAWAKVPDCPGVDGCAPASPKQFATYAAAAVNHFKAAGVTDWEIWNEPNSSGTWDPQPNAAAYAELLKAAYPAIKAADPRATVITGGLGVTYTDDKNISPEDFLTALYNNGAQNSFDAVAMHSYSFPAQPVENLNWSGWTQMLHLRDIMVARGDGAKQLWVTEYGAPTKGPGYEATIANQQFAVNPDHVNEEFQAILLTQAIRLYSTYPWAGPFFVYGYKDMGSSTGTNENFFGLVRADGSHKPSYAAFQAAIAGN